MAITVKQAELAGAGVIRSADVIKKTLRGKIYEATVYYEEAAINVKILCGRTGSGWIIGPSKATAEELNKYEAFLRYIVPRMPRPNYKTLGATRLAIMFSVGVTAANIMSITNTTGIVVAVVDILLLTALVALERVERNRYV